MDVNIIELKNDWLESELGHRSNQHIKNHFYNHLLIDIYWLLKRSDHVGKGMEIPQSLIHLGNRITDKLLVYTAEMMAVIVGLQWVEEVRSD